MVKLLPILLILLGIVLTLHGGLRLFPDGAPERNKMQGRVKTAAFIGGGLSILVIGILSAIQMFQG